MASLDAIALLWQLEIVIVTVIEPRFVNICYLAQRKQTEGFELNLDFL